MKNKVVIDDVVELYDRLKEQNGFELCGANGMAGFDFDLDMARVIASTLTDILNDIPRSEPRYLKREGV